MQHFKKPGLAGFLFVDRRRCICHNRMWLLRTTAALGWCSSSGYI